MSKFLLLVAIILCAVNNAAAQTEAELKQYFEGRHVTMRIDMPATKDGVNVYPERTQPLNYSEYANRIKRNGTSVRRGEAIMVTKVKVKDKHIEFQLGGGGYGTVGDETDTSIHVQSAGKSRREKRLEDDLKRENDPSRRRRIKEELDDLRRDREREDRINQALAADAAEERRARIEEKALQGGSRFNIHFSMIGADELKPAALVEALRKYVDFSDIEKATRETVSPFQPTSLRSTSDRHSSARVPGPSVVRLGPPTTYLSAGLSTREVVRLLGQPVAVSERSEQDRVVTTYEFSRSAGRVIVAEFVGGLLVRSQTETRGQVIQVNGL